MKALRGADYKKYALSVIIQPSYCQNYKGAYTDPSTPFFFYHKCIIIMWWFKSGVNFINRVYKRYWRQFYFKNLIFADRITDMLKTVSPFPVNFVC